MQLSLATYNIHRCVGQDGRYDPDRVLDVLRELHANVIALQEVDSREHRGLELLYCMANELGYTPIAGPTLLRQDGHYGNAVLTNLDVVRVQRVDLSVPGREPRGALDIDLNCKGIGLHVVATHLGLWPSDRRVQVQRLLRQFKPESPDPAVLMGDLNEWMLWARQLRRLQRLFGRSRAFPTFPARFPVFPLDRIWVHPRKMLTSLKVHKTAKARAASDHLPLKAVIQINLAQPGEKRAVTAKERPYEQVVAFSPAGA